MLLRVTTACLMSRTLSSASAQRTFPRYVTTGKDCHVQLVTSAPAKVLTYHHSHQLQTLRVRSHGVGRYDPASLAQLVSNREFVVLVVVLRVQAECDQRKALPASLREDEESELLERPAEVISGVGQVPSGESVSMRLCWK